MHMFCPAWSTVPPCGCRRAISYLSFCIVLFAVCEGEFCSFAHRRKVSAQIKIYHRVDHPMNEYDQDI